MMQNTKLILYYQKITDLALINLKDEKGFRFKSKLNNDVFMSQIDDHLRETYKKAGGDINSPSALKMIDEYKEAMKKMHVMAGKSYDEALRKLRNTKDPIEKQKILNTLAGKGFSGFRAKDGKIWNIETYSNMYFTALNNELVRMAVLDQISENTYIRISVHSTKCNLCKPYEGQRMKKMELANARANGLFHPNCLHIVLPDK